MISWPIIMERMRECERCGLHAARQSVVIGEGNFAAKAMFIGEGPGAEEDRQGRPFVGPAGQLLDKMLASIGLSRKEVYIANIVKCRPPGNRAPTDEEAAACMDYLRGQFRLIRPAVIVCLGATPSKHIIDPGIRVTRDRGKWTQRGGVWIMPTYHPAALLRDPAKKADSYEDLKSIKRKLEELNG